MVYLLLVHRRVEMRIQAVGGVELLIKFVAFAQNS